MALFTGCTPANPPPPPARDGFRILASIQVTTLPGAAAAGAGSLWIADYAEGELTRIDAHTNRVVATIPISPVSLAPACEPGAGSDASPGSFIIRRCDLPSGLAVGAGSVWTGRNDRQEVVRIDPTTNRVTASIPVGIHIFDIAATQSAVWVTSYEDDIAVRIDPDSNQVVAIVSGFHGPSGVLITDAAVWIVNTRAGLVSQVDPQTNQVVGTTPVGTRPFPVAMAEGSLWVRSEQDNSVSRIDLDSGQVTATFPTDPFYGTDGLDSIASDKRGMWISGRKVQRIDPFTNRVVTNLPVTGRPLSAGDGTLWVVGIAGTVERVDPGID